MTPMQLLSLLEQKGVQVTFRNESLHFWPEKLVSQVDLAEIKRLKPDILNCMRGYFELKRGNPIVTENGFETIWEAYPSLSRIGTIDREGIKRFYNINQIASADQYLFLKRRYNRISSIVYKRDQPHWNQVFHLFKAEWDYMFKEINRQQFLIESWCGPIRKGKHGNWGGGNNELHRM